MDRFPDMTSRVIQALAIAIGFACLPAANARTWEVSQCDPRADDSGAGTADQPLRTISRAAELAGPGDTVLVHAGTYRERVAPARGGLEGSPIVYRAVPGEQVVIKGSDIYSGPLATEPNEPGVVRLSLDPSLFGKTGYNPFATPLLRVETGRTLGQVFVNDEQYREVGEASEVRRVAGTWTAQDAGRTILLHLPGSAVLAGSKRIELTTRSRIFAPYLRGLGYIHVVGFTMLHCANQFPSHFWDSDSPQAGALGCRGGHHWLIEGNTIRFAKSLGLDCGSEGEEDADGLHQPEPKYSGYHRILSNTISDNGAGGLAASHALETYIIGNTFERNNSMGHTAPESAALKTHFFIRGRIEGNLFRDNECYGIWCDNVYVDVRITRNVLLNNRDAGIFMEMGGGPALIDNNIVAMTRGASTGWHNGSGFFAHDAGGFTLAHNLFVANADYGILVRQEDERRYMVYPASTLSWEGQPSETRPCLPEHIQIVNNVVLDNHRGAVSFPLPGPEADQNRCDGNLYTRGDLDFVPFVVNSHHGVRAVETRDLILARIADSQQPDAQVPLPYSRGPLVAFAQWRSVGFDPHGAVGAYAANVRALDLSLTVGTGPLPGELVCKLIPGVTQDIFGRTLPDNPLPGPFQMIGESPVALTLWPMPCATDDISAQPADMLPHAPPPPIATGSALARLPD